MKKLLFALALLMAPLMAAAQDYIGTRPPDSYGSPQRPDPYVNGGIIAQQNYTQSAATTTAGGSAYTYFSTVTIRGKAFAKNGDTVVASCHIDITVSNEMRNIVMAVNGVAISSRAITTNPSGSDSIGFLARYEITRTSTDRQIAACISNSTGGCSSNAAGTIGTTLIQADDDLPISVTCSAMSQTQGALNFKQLILEFKPAP